ncbi:putative Epidermal patterning factor-like protein [Quillaja saponaria]|uniref:Epidermal patterning factor-like protein n=1 Tax=Quillaja saponaria TaxID=32244 RepID=A0AAD7PEF4_QUISA|nr:putative Epidermal patterning factor-like protein [Quillaja saponaria]
MAPSSRTSYSLHELTVSVTVAFIIFLPFLPTKSGGSLLLVNRTASLEESKMVLGSKPPACVNKCLNCRPCMVTLVIPTHQKKGFAASSSHREEDSYYLLSWKCRCGNRLFQP